MSQERLKHLVDPSLNSTLRSREDRPDSAKVKNINKTKKKLDSARRSRIQQIKESVVNTNSSNEDDLLCLDHILMKVESAGSVPVLAGSKVVIKKNTTGSIESAPELEPVSEVATDNEAGKRLIKI